MKPLLLFGIILISISIQAQVSQEWVARYNRAGNNYDVCKAIAIDSAGNVYVTGYSIGNGTLGDYATIKYNSLGVQQWSARYNGPGNNEDGAYSIAVDQNGNVYVTGYSTGDGTGWDFATIKYNSIGTQLWIARYNGSVNGGDIAKSIAVDQNGNVFVTGTSQENGTGSDFTTIRYNSQGIELWVTHYNGPGPGNNPDDVSALALDQFGNIYVTGSSDGNGTSLNNYATIKYNSLGIQQWVAIYNNELRNSSDNATALAIDTSGNVYVTGSSAGTGTFWDYATVKYNSSGSQQWVSRYNGPGSNSDDRANCIAINSLGDVYVSGRSDGISTLLDYATIKYNSAGEQQWEARYNGPGNSLDESMSIALDDSGSVYVTGTSAGTSRDYATVKYDTDGIEKWVQRYNGTGNFSDEAIKIITDQYRNVYVTGYSIGNGTGNDYATVKYSQGLNITEPQAGEKWIAGETDTIRWTGGQPGQFVSIEYSTDNGQTYNLIELSAPADSQYYVWNIPSTLLSTSSKIKLTDLQTSTELAVSDSFKVKGYVLTRLDENGQYVAFSSAAHGWSYPNGTLWPQSWFSQFQYSTATDPYTNEPYPNFFHSAPDSSFVDWPLWVEVFGEDQCYWSTFLGIYKGEAERKWQSKAVSHNGSCFGFAGSSFLAFNFRNQFFPRHPGVPNVSNIFGLFLTNTIQKTINGYFAYQFGKQSLDNDIIGNPKDPRTTLIEIMNMFKNDATDVRTITILRTPPPGLKGGAHTMAPISVTVDNTGPSRYRVNLYDSNNPGLNTPYILVDSLNNTWQDFTGLGIGWNGSNKFYLEIPVSNYLNTPVMGKKLLKPNGIANIEFYNNEKANIMFTNSSGQKIGVTNGVVTDELQDGIAIFNKNGKPSDPIGYYVPDDNYSVVLSNITDTSGRAFFSAFKQDVIYNYERENVNISQVDKFNIDNGFSVISQDFEDKQINLSVIAKLDSSERILFVQETQLRQNDSLFLRETNQSEFIMKNYGTSKTYKLEINERSSQEQEIFQNLSISLQENSSHIIQPNWADLDGSILNILVDIGNNGTIDDTLSIVNQVTGIGDDQGTLLTPNSYNLAQNFPNPFNPTTTIQYSIPQRSNVTLKVYDVLGNEIAALVNEAKDRGVYSVNFDASQLASGIYLYRIQAGSFVETKKMILMK